MRRIPLVMALSLCLRAQIPTYEVAAVKHNDGNIEESRFMPSPDGRFLATNVTVEELITFAYNVTNASLLEGTPSWARSEHYDVEATPSEARLSDRPQLQKSRDTLQAVLRDRFRLVVRLEPRQIPVYVLTADAQLKMKRSPDGGVGNSKGSQNVMRMGPGAKIMGRGVEMAQLARALTGYTGRPVEDRTGLAGRYDFDLEWTPDPATLPPGVPALATGDGASLFTALREQLGLKLSSSTGTASVVVVESVERPGEN